MKDEELLELVDLYNKGEYSFAEVLLASGKSVKELIRFLKKYKIELRFNVDFMDKGRGLEEEVLQMILKEKGG